MRIATWNVNSIKAREAVVVRWLKETAPDIALLQELKCEAGGFPRQTFEDLGYNIALKGQKTYNGVAVLSKTEIEVLADGLPGNEDDPQARYLEVFTGGLRCASIYLPNGNPIPGLKFDYKLAWMKHLKDRAAALLESEDPVVLGGDYNVIPRDIDVYDAKAFADDALAQPESRAAFRRILNLGYTEAWQTLHGQAHCYSFWDYQAGAWQKDNGLRIDHFLLSAQAADRVEACDIDKTPRGWEKPSDHTPVVLTLKD